MGEEDDRTCHGQDDCLGARTERGSRPRNGTLFPQPWQRLGWRDLPGQIGAIKKNISALKEGDTRQKDGPFVHKATVPPGLRQAAAEDQNCCMSNQCT